MGGASAAGLRPGFGRGGTTHSLCVKVEGVGRAAGLGIRGLWVAEDVDGASTCGEAAELRDDALEVDIVNEIPDKVTARFSTTHGISAEIHFHIAVRSPEVVRSDWDME